MASETPQNLIAVAKATDRRGKNRLPPAIPDPAGIARDYRSVIRAMVDAYAQEVDDLLTPTIESALSERGDSIRTDSWIDRLRSALSGVWERTLGRRRDAERAIKEIGQDVVSHNQKGFKRQIQATLGVDVTLNEPWLSDELEAWAAANSTLVSSVAEEAHQRVSRMAIDGVRQGRSVRDIEKDLTHQFGLSKNRAQVIARTETAKLNSELSERRQKEVGINTYYWQTSRDERVRDDHRAMNGKLCRWDDAEVYSDDGGETWKKRSGIGGVEVHPGRDFQCFPGSVKVDGSPAFDVLYRRFYSGELSNIVFDNGRVLSATPNHPILTPEGFKPIHLLNRGDYVLGASHEGFSAVELDAQRFVPTFEQVYRALVEMFLVPTVSTGDASQFHGDGTDGEVEVVSVDSFLVDKWDASARQKFLKLGLTDTDMMVCNSLFSGFGNSDTVLKALGHSDARGVRRLDLISSLFFRHLAPFEQFGFALRAGSDASINQPGADSGSGNAEVFSDCIFAVSVLIHGSDLIDWKIKSLGLALMDNRLYAHSAHAVTESVVGVTESGGDFLHGHAFGVQPLRIEDSFVSQFAGHVHNLQTKTGYYHANSVASSNCRCTSRPNTEEVLKQL